MEAHLFGLNQRAASPSAAKPRRTTLDAAALSRSYMPPPREVSRATPLHLELNHLSFHVLHGFVGNQMRGLPQQGGAPQVGSLPPTRPKTASSPVVGKLDYARFAKPCSVEELGALQRELADWRAQQREEAEGVLTPSHLSPKGSPAAAKSDEGRERQPRNLSPASSRWAAAKAKTVANMSKHGEAVRKIVNQAKLAREQQRLQAPGRTGKDLMGALKNTLNTTVQVKNSGLTSRPQLVNQAPTWHRMTASERAAAEAFDNVHRDRVEKAHKTLAKSKSAGAGCLPTDPTSRAFNAQLREVRFNRFHVVQALENVVVAQKPVRPIKREVEVYVNDVEMNFTIPKSIFGPRVPESMKNQGDLGYYDNPDKIRKCLELDMSLALKTHKMDSSIEQQGGPDEAKAVLDVIIEFGHVIYGVYDFYCTLSKGDDICHMWVPGFKRFIMDIGFEDKDSKTCTPNDVLKLWKMLNSDPTESANYINRYEWLQCLIRLAMMKYCPEVVKDPEPNSVASALRKLITADIDRCVDRRALADTNLFRTHFCYVEDVDSVFREWEPSLKALFKVYAFGDGVIDELKSTELLGFDEWMNFVTDLDLLHVVDFTAREAACAFSWSRLRQIDERPVKAKVQLTQLSFEEFLEALVRVSSFKVIPLDDEVQAAGCEDAGELMIQRKSMPAGDLESLLKESVVDWDDHLNQPMFHLIEGLISYIVRMVVGTGATKISKKDAERFKQGMDAGGGAEREKLKTKARSCFIVKPVEPKPPPRDLSEDFRIMASLFGCVNGTQPMYDA